MWAYSFMYNVYKINVIVGVWGVGLATKRCNVNVAPLGQDSESWVLTHDATMYHNKEQKGTLSQGLNEGDILVMISNIFYIILVYLAVVCRQISPISYSIWDKLHWQEPNSAKFQNLTSLLWILF